MNKQEAQKEIKKLAQAVEEHNYRYYVLNDPVISDKEYDDLMKKLIGLEEKFPELRDPHSPAQRVGVKLSAEAAAITHKVKMLSLSDPIFFSSLFDDVIEGSHLWHCRKIVR